MRKLKIPVKKKGGIKLRKPPKLVKPAIGIEADWRKVDISFELEDTNDALILYWKHGTTSPYKNTDRYLKGRYPEGNPIGDFLKAVLKIKLGK